MDFLKHISIPIGLPLFLIVGSLIAHSCHKHKSSQSKTMEDFFERERLANSTRKQDISHLDYLVLDLSLVPLGISQDSVLKDLEDKLHQLSHKQILNLSDKSNTDLKMMYGPANLDTLWAVLEYASSLQIDVSQIYILLAKLYQNTGTPEKISNIYTALEAMDENFRSYVLKHLESSHAGE